MRKTAALARSLSAVLLSATLLVPAVLPVRAEKATPTRIAANLSHFTLANGLEVVVIPDRRAPVATHMVWYRVGAADEPAGQSGVAHFLEHLMFKGTRTRANGEFSATVAGIGGQENAFTSFDYTAYFQRVAREHLPLMMELEADRMHNLVLSDEVVAPERDVVLEERRMRVDSDPSSRLQEALSAVTYVNHPYGSPVIGWQSEIEALNSAAAIDFYNRFYTPNNAVLVVAGDVDAEEVRKLAEQTYGKVPRRAEPEARLRPGEPPLAGSRSVHVEDERVRQPAVSWTWLVPSQTTGTGREPEALELLAQILGGGPTSRLYRSAFLEKQIAVDIGAYYLDTALDSTRFMLYASPRGETTLGDLEAEFRTAVQEIAEKGVSADELARAKHSLVSSAIYAQDSQMGLARLFGAALTSGQTVEDVQTWPSQIAAVTAEDVQAVARAYLLGEPVTGYLTPPDKDHLLKPTASAVPAAGQRS
ncbi:M16 family metallopeptidase [Pannonibacter tanglangensis]|uniref:Insulinase family protein n=1 Tax=Pannonibacter tanglangensis TaxID=2750084 RepID=A0ABW9ZHY6_9HYPH|nr:pitrilysin family protein [Pannonibacter sp. XCT-34]NBN64475.1 insulinase family protein [Pannonibacter sp. XCT-34]